MRLTDFLSILPQYRVIGNPDVEITGVAFDSRRVCPGTLFVAYRGVNVDGHGFIGAALKNGAVAVVGERDVSEVIVPYIMVPNGREALAWLSAAWHSFPARQLTMIGVTGTDGKTTTVNLLHHILQAAGRNVGMISTVNAVIGDTALDTGLHTTTPDAPDVQRLLAQMVADGADVCVLEVTSHGLAQHRVTACDFDVAIVTNVTHEHLDIHGSLDAYRAAKAILFQELAGGFRKPETDKISILNRGDSSFDYLQPHPADLRLSYNVGKPGDVIAYNLIQTPDQTHFEIESRYARFSMETKLLGTFNVFNILAATAAALALGVEPEAIQRGVAALESIPGRMERVDRGQPFTAIVDFAHTPNSLRRALETARGLTTRRRVIAVFGCAGLRDVEKRPLMGRIAALAQPGDVVIACGKGHEQSMCFGETEYSWDDRKALAAALEGGPLKTLTTAK